MAKVPKGAQLRAEQSVAASIAQADAVVTLADDDGEAARQELLDLLRAADKRVALRLAALTPTSKGEMRFSAAQAIAYRAQINHVIASVEGNLEGIAIEAGDKAVNKSVAGGAKLLAKLERDFKGVSVSPSIMAAMQQSHVLRGPKAALVTSVATSVDRYGMQMGRQFSRIIQEGLLAGDSNERMVQRLVDHGGPKGRVSLAARVTPQGIVQRIREGDIPEGLFVRHRYWAERIIRTEVAYAYSSARLASLYAMRTEGLDVQKKIVAVFDSRTAPDSIAVHGQVHRLEDPFTDGAGRVYQHPPGRPNDRETLIPWFDDYTELPSTAPPTVAEQQRATELASTAVSSDDDTNLLKPESLEDLERLKAEAAAAAQLAKQREQDEADAEALTMDTGRERQTRAAALLLEHERDKIKQAQEILIAQQQKAEDAAAAAALELEQKQRSKIADDLVKVDKSVAGKLKGPEPHLAVLELYELAMLKPDHFVTLLKAFLEEHEQLPHASLVHGLATSFAQLNEMMADVLAGFGKVMDIGPVKAVTALDTFKHSPQFVPWLDELAGKKDAKSQRLLAALIHSEQETLLEGTSKKAQPAKTSIALAKAKGATKQKALDKIKAKYPPPAPAIPWVIKDGGAGYTDIYQPDGKTKLAFFKKTPAGKYVVDPTNVLDPSKWPKREYETPELATSYAVQVGLEIQNKPKVQKQLNTTTTKRFNFDPATGPKGKLGPLVINDPAVAREIAQGRKAAGKYFDKNGIVLRRTGRQPNAVDSVLEEQRLSKYQNAWSGVDSKCWYGSSGGPKSAIARFVTRSASYRAREGHAEDESELGDARALARQLADEGQPGMQGTEEEARELIRYARAKYAATQEAIARRMKPGGDLHGKVDAEGYVVLHRGIAGNLALKARQAREQGKTTTVAHRSVASWTFKREATRPFTDHHNIALTARVHVSRIFSQYEAEEIAMRRFGDKEAEYIVMGEGETQATESLNFDSEDISHLDNE